MKGVLIIKGEFRLYQSNDLYFSGDIKAGLRLSAWKNSSNFTALEIKEVLNAAESISLGSKGEIVAAFMNSNLTKSLKVGDTVFCGSPNKKIGELLIGSID